MTIRPARLEDAPAAAFLLAETMGGFGTALFGLGERSRELRMLERLLCMKRSRLSHAYVHIEELEGKPAGLLLSYPGRDSLRRMLPLGWQLPLVYGLGGFLRLVTVALHMPLKTEVKSDEYLIAHLAVHPDFRRRGVGRSLMLYAESLARRSRLGKCALEVELGNLPARALYTSLGYQSVERVDLSHIPSLGTPGYERMVKTL